MPLLGILLFVWAAGTLPSWDAFKAERFPGDEARKLAIVLGLDLEGDIIRTKRLAAKKGADVVLNLPKARRKKGMVDPDLEAFNTILDAVHTSMMVYDEDGARALQVLAKGPVVFDDTVVDHREAAGGVRVRMGVLLGGTAVRCPAGVAQTDGPEQVRPPHRIFQLLDLSDGAVDDHAPLLQDG